MSDPTSRRTFLGSTAALTAGLVLPGRVRCEAARYEVQQVSPEARLRELGITLPSAPRPIATYVPAVLVGNVLYAAGHTPRLEDGSPGFIGKVGDDYSIEQGQAAAYQCGLNILSTVRNALGSLDRVERLVRTFGMVNATPDFRDQPRVTNGFSDLMVDIFGEDRGKGTRAAVGMSSLPGGQAAEVETHWLVRT